MGIGKNDWFVCIFARDDAYLKSLMPDRDMSYHNYRDSDIDTLELSIKYILEKGGFVIRLGKVVAKEMKFKHPKVIDYPFTHWRSDFMDIYLQKRAKFVLSSSTSGCTDVTYLFDTPYCGANMEGNFIVVYRHAICIPKKYKVNNEWLSLKKFIDLANSYHEIKPSYYGNSAFYTENHLEIIPNSPQEILDLTKEMFERLEGTFIQTQEDKQLQEEFQKIYHNFIRAESYLVAPHDPRNPIGRQFLRDNHKWYLATQ